MNSSDIGNAIVDGLMLAAGLIAAACFALGGAVVGLIWWLA